ncbi:MAG: cation-translocating P-type ATPase [Burkholderiales bacterium]|nr:MAG: cation-translocating P-type ATPase [Burkholderiales bacterium]
MATADSPVDRPGAGAVPDDYLALDDAEVQAVFTRPTRTESGRESFLSIEGIDCAACAVAIDERLRAMPGVHAVDVNVAARTGRIVWDPARVRLSALFAAIRDLGYLPYPAGDSAARARRDAEHRGAIWRLFVAGFCAMQVMMYAVPVYVAQPGDMTADVERLLYWASWMMALPVLAFAARPFFAGALADLRQRRVGMDTPVALAMGITFVASSWALFEGVGEVYFDTFTMFVFFLLGGRYLEHLARRRAIADLERLTRRLPASVERLDGYPSHAAGERVAVHRIRAGDAVRVATGEAFPGDGTVLDGASSADESLLTGESRPVAKAAGDAVIAGSYNLTGPLVVRVERIGRDSRYGQVLDLMERAAGEKPRLARIADRYARWFLVLVLVLAAAAGLAWSWAGSERALWIAVSVLIVTCPCALSLAAPVSIIAATSRLAREGVLVAHPQAFEALAQATHVIFDKTGTVTANRPVLDAIEPLAAGIAPERALAIAAALERGSLHPVARAICAAQEALGAQGALSAQIAQSAQSAQGAQGAQSAQLPRPEALAETAGGGIEAVIDGKRWRIGTAAFVAALPGSNAQLERAVRALESLAGGSVAVLAGPRGPVAAFRVRDALREDARPTVDELARAGLRTLLVSGDRAESVDAVARELGIGQAQGEALPQHKLQAVAALQDAGHRVIMVGDGLNDGPVLTRADVSFAVGAGAPIAQSSADFVLLSDRLGAIAFAHRLARRTLRVTRQNLGWAVLYNAACVPLALAGMLPPWLAALGMASSSLLVVLNALRLAR